MNDEKKIVYIFFKQFKQLCLGEYTSNPEFSTKQNYILITTLINISEYEWLIVRTKNWTLMIHSSNYVLYTQ